MGFVAGFGVVFGAVVFEVDDELAGDGPAMRSHISLAWSATDFSDLDDFGVDEPEEDPDGLRGSSSKSAAASRPSRTSSDEKRDGAGDADLIAELVRPDESG